MDKDLINQKGNKEEDSEDLFIMLEQCKKESQEYLDGWKRAKADSENDRKARVKLLEEERNNIKQEFIITILPIFDSVKAALSHSSEDKTLYGGVTQIQVQLEQVFAQFDAVTINPIGEEFNPHEHEAIGEKDVDVEDKNNTVLEVVRIGVSVNGSVIRPAMVYVGKYINN